MLTRISARLLLLTLIWASARAAEPSSFLISESMWPQGCVLDCARGRHRAVCGSNGQLYKSLCAFQRAHCLNTQLTRAPIAHCIVTREPDRAKDPAKSKCQLARAKALEAVNSSDTAAVFVPECSENGTFLQVQCHSHTGYCWCSTPDGKPVSGTSVLHQRPNCTGPEFETVLVSSVYVQREDGRVRPTPDSSLSNSSSLPVAEITDSPVWVTVLLNSDPKENRHVRPPAGTPRACELERATLLAEAQSANQEELFVAECSPDGRYKQVQCHVATGYCWCVRTDTGRPLPSTSARNQLPDCSEEEKMADRSNRARPLPGCPSTQKKAFLQRLLRTLELEVQQAGDVPSLQWNVDVALEVSASPVPEAFSPSSLDGGGSRQDKARRVLRWHFLQLDVNRNGALSEHESRPLRVYLRRWLHPRRCAKKFAQRCDRNGDRSLTLAELTHCLGL